MADYEKFLRDREFADAFTASYSGRHHPADALWWMSHPQTTSPRGEPSPSADLARLKALAYSRAGGADARLALASLESSLEADREATSAALALAVSASPHITPEAVLSTHRTPVPELVMGSATTEQRRGWGRIVAIAAVVALVVGFAAGARFGRAMFPFQTTAAPSPAAATEPLSRWANGPPRMFDVFDTKQVAADIPTTIPAGNPLLTDSIRLVVRGVESSGKPTHAVYVAKNIAGSPCLILIIGDGAQTTMNCVPEADIPITGLSVYLQTATDYWTCTWQTDGTILSSTSLTDDASAADD